MLSSDQRPLKPLNCKLLSYQSLNRHCLVHAHPSRDKCFVADSIPIYFYIIPVQGVALGVIIPKPKPYSNLLPRFTPPPCPTAHPFRATAIDTAAASHPLQLGRGRKEHRASRAQTTTLVLAVHMGLHFQRFCFIGKRAGGCRDPLPQGY